MTSKFEQTERNTVRRVPNRGYYDHETVFRVIDAAWIGHVAFADSASQQVTVIPMLHARDKDELIFHGAKSSRLMRFLGSGNPVSVSFASVDGLVLAKSLFHHSMNYRSAVVFGFGIAEPRDNVLASLRILSDKIMPGRWEDARQPSDRELAATAVVRVKIVSASAKVRSGDPVDEQSDVDLPVWSGILPLSEHAGELIADPNSQAIAVPRYVAEFRKRLNRRSAMS